MGYISSPGTTTGGVSFDGGVVANATTFQSDVTIDTEKKLLFGGKISIEYPNQDNFGADTLFFNHSDNSPTITLQFPRTINIWANVGQDGQTGGGRITIGADFVRLQHADYDPIIGTNGSLNNAYMVANEVDLGGDSQIKILPSKMSSDVDIEIINIGDGLIIPSPNGTRWMLTPSNAGASVWTSL